MKTKTWIGLGIGAAIAATIVGVLWALRAGPPASMATSSGPAASSGAPSPGATVADVDPSRGPQTQAPSTGDSLSDFFSRGFTLLDGALS